MQAIALCGAYGGLGPGSPGCPLVQGKCSTIKIGANSCAASLLLSWETQMALMPCCLWLLLLRKQAMATNLVRPCTVLLARPSGLSVQRHSVPR